MLARDFLLQLLVVAAALIAPLQAKPSPPVWPEQLHAILIQDRNGSLADVDLWYDWPGGRNLNIIKSREDGSVLYDNERNNGSTYYYHPSQGDCKVLDMHVGILRPNWLEGADFKGVDVIKGRKAYVWAKNSSMHHPFITYYEDIRTTEPLRWVFFDNGTFDVVSWLPTATLDEAEWQLPSYCFV